MKYKNPKVSKDIIFNGLNVDWDSDIVLVEGVFHAMKCRNAIPLLGSTLRENSILFQKICERKPNVYLALDDDVFRDWINDVLEAAYEDGRWAAAWEGTAGSVLETPEPPAVDRY